MANSRNDMKAVHKAYANLASQIQVAMQPALKDIARANNLIESMALSLQPSISAAKAVEKALAPIMADFERVQKQMAPVWAEISEHLQKLPERNRKALCTLGLHGWYVDSEMSFPVLFQITRALESADPSGATEQLCSYFEARLDEIEKRLVEASPRRARIINAALGAHRRKEFSLSIPVLLAQADGVCFDLTGVQLYTRRNGGLRPVFESEPFTPYRESLFAPLLNPMPLTAGKNERSASLSTLNRHAILHGECTDYDTRVNSCRAISLLLFITWVLWRPRGADLH